jgi:hypothetical protein
MDERLIRFLKIYIPNTGKTVYEGSHADIALALSSSREVIRDCSKPWNTIKRLCYRATK